MYKMIVVLLLSTVVSGCHYHDKQNGVDTHTVTCGPDTSYQGLLWDKQHPNDPPMQACW